MTAKVSVIIPAYNEADVISHTIQAALKISEVAEVIVVDDGSSDSTADIARSAGAHKVIIQESNQGKGGALNKAWPSSTGEILLLLDADLGDSAGEAEKLLQPVLNDKADMAIAVFGRSAVVSGKLAAKSRGFGLAMKTARLGIRMLTGKSIESPLAGPRALKREIVDKTDGFESKFGVEVGLTIDALRMGYRVVEIPVAMVHRPSGRDLKGFMHRGRQMMDVVRTLGRKALGI